MAEPSVLRRPWLLALVAFAGAGVVLLSLERGPAPARAAASYVGRASCASCHAAEAAAFEGSHHDLAMQPASAATVLGDFAEVTFTHYDVTSTFFRDGERFVVRTDGPDGVLRDFPIAYVFGVTPLQQYLIDLGGGRLQALSVAWDAREREAGGQRWYHLYPHERVPAGDELHWTGPQQNWNHMCAECHSTHLQKGYDSAQDRFATTWAEIDVACEACHGSGSQHVAWARGDAAFAELGQVPGKGLPVAFDERRGVAWGRHPDTGQPVRNAPRTTSKELDTCARCHSRRSTFAEDFVPGRSLLETHWPALLTDGLYHVTGRMQDEVYNHQSFLLSRMHAHGVTCSDCHEPHSGRLRAPGNAVCTQCHDPRYERPEHHRHAPGSAAAQCVACHMPTSTYMGVDVRHDHSFAVPRPDLTERFGAPNACNDCHRDQTPAWAHQAIEAWHGPVRTDRYPWAAAFAAARRGAAGARDLLATLLADPELPAIARATALHQLPEPLDATAVAALVAACGHPEPLVRWAAAERAADAGAPIAALEEPLRRLLTDPVRGVRIGAAWALRSSDRSRWPAEARAEFAAAFAAYEAAQRSQADRPEGRLNLGNLALDRGDRATAAADFEAALRLMPTFLPARINLADLQRTTGDETACERTLRAGLALAPDHPDLLHALGLCLVRQQRLAEALSPLGAAARGAPARARYAYVHAVALHEAGRRSEALATVEAAHSRHRDDPDLSELLADYRWQAGDQSGARAAAAEFAARWPDTPATTRLRQRFLH